MSLPSGVHRDQVRLPSGTTAIEVGPGLRHRLWLAIGQLFPTAFHVGVVVDRQVADLWPLDLPEVGPTPVVVRAPPGEASKNRAVLARIQDRLLALRREEPVVAIGGGAVLDAAGFAAATVRRGLPWVAVPTSVVAMADAAVGGKVAVNHRRGKNLLGTFHHPRLVLADVDYLTTLPPRDVSAGLAEVYKSARIGDPELLARLRHGTPDDSAAWTKTLAAAVNVKARVVEADERDVGLRRTLNYGHTVGHALERLVPNDVLRHGEAVAIGMGVAARIARARGLVASGDVDRQAEDLVRLGLPVDLPSGLPASALLDAMSLDKKRRPGVQHTFVVPVGEHGVEVLEDVEEEEVRRAL